MLGAALDLSIPPLTLLVALWLAVGLFAGVAWWLGASWLPVGLLAGGGVALAAALGLGWATFCRRQVPLRTFAAVPLYMLRKLPIYVGFLFRQQHAWVRTERTAMLADESLESRRELRNAPAFTVLGVRVRNVTRLQATELLEEAICRRNDRARSVFFVNAHTLNRAAADTSYRCVLNAADFVFADGTGVRWAARLQGVRVLENMVGTDFIPALFQATAGRGYSYFLLGADARTVAVAADYARRAFPGSAQAGCHHGYLTDPWITTAAIAQINAARPDVLLVGMGNPLQEQWIHRHIERLNVRMCMGVGGLFDHWADNISRASLAPAVRPRVALAALPTAAFEGQPLPHRQSVVSRASPAGTFGGRRPTASFRALGEKCRVTALHMPGRRFSRRPHASSAGRLGWPVLAVARNLMSILPLTPPLARGLGAAMVA